MNTRFLQRKSRVAMLLQQHRHPLEWAFSGLVLHGGFFVNKFVNKAAASFPNPAAMTGVLKR